MKVDVLNMQGKKVDTTELPPAIFEAPVKKDLMHQALVRQLANARLGTHKTKSRGEVSGGGRKPWRQKGTGRARHGSRRSPIWVGGGKAHTPRPRKYTRHMPRKMRRAALRSALSVKAAQKEVVVLDELKMERPKTKEMVAILERLVGQASALILLAESNETIEKSVRNLPDAKTLRANYLNVRDLLGYERLIMPLGALDIIQSYLGS
ncbi:MAG: 50S ribosomal protein L4 [Anaerolineales bacterium]|jgi:large subunit ribosomal protein L4|nr:MAG: 50S ribosomal protein L4 [Anaerolineales bacterium]